jgi:endoglucanase
VIPRATLCGAVILALLPTLALSLPVERCVNLGNSLDAPTEGAWGPALQRGDLTWIAAQGFDTVRLPVRFSAHWDGQIDPAFLARVDEVIGWAREDGLKIILDLHHFEALMTDPVGQTPVFQAIWAELGDHYAGAPDDLMFELLNEPNNLLSQDRLPDLYAPVIADLRTQHPDRWIIVGGGNWNNIAGMLALEVPDDPRIALTFHYYSPFEFTHQRAEWVTPVMPASDWGTDQDKRRLQSDMGWASGRDLPILLGEFGAYSAADPGQRAAWTATARRAAEAQGFGWCVWALDAGFPIRVPGTDDWVTGMQDALLAP